MHDDHDPGRPDDDARRRADGTHGTHGTGPTGGTVPRSDDDPLTRLERRDYGWRPALKYTGSVIAATLVTALVIGIAGAVAGGPNCDSGDSAFICSRTWELAFPLIPGAVSLVGALIGFYLTYRRWKSFGNWRPWLAMCWVLMPFTLFWMTSTFPIAMLGVQ